MILVEPSSTASANGMTVRALHVHSGNLYGGVETFLRTLARSREHAPALNIEFALCFEGRLAAELGEAAATVHLLGQVRFRSLASVIAARRRLAATLSANRYEVVTCHSAWSHCLFAPVVRQQDACLAFYLHDVPNRFVWHDQWANRTPPDLILCNSDFTARSGSWLFPGVPRRVSRLPLAFEPRHEPQARRSVRAALGVSDETVVILHATRMQSWKGHELLISALARLRPRTPWLCWFAGGTQRSSELRYKAGLEESVRRLGLLDHVTFLGERGDIPDLMAAADIYCQPNVAPEPFGLSYVEALASGRPVVSTRMGGALEIVTPSCGVLVQPRARPLASALSELIDDGARRSEMARSARARARELCGTRERVAELAAHLTSLARSDRLHGRI